jgi:hypothetical protein
MKSASIVAVLAAMLLVSSTLAQEKAAPVTKDQADESVKKVKKLREERIATLEEVVDDLTILFKASRGDYEDLLEAQRVLIEAKLEYAETDEERVKLYEKLVAILKKRETYAEGLAQAGRVVRPIVLKAKARRLAAEIHLEQAKMKLAKPAK